MAAKVDFTLSNAARLVLLVFGGLIVLGLVLMHIVLGIADNSFVQSVRVPVTAIVATICLFAASTACLTRSQMWPAMLGLLLYVVFVAAAFLSAREVQYMPSAHRFVERTAIDFLGIDLGQARNVIIDAAGGGPRPLPSYERCLELSAFSVTLRDSDPYGEVVFFRGIWPWSFSDADLRKIGPVCPVF